MTGHPNHVADDANDRWEDDEDQIETTSVRPEHLTEGMIVHDSNGARETIDAERCYNPWGEDDFQIRFVDGTHMWVRADETVEVEC